MFKLLKKEKIFIVLLGLILFIATISRLVFLNRVPGAVGGDELTYILTAKYIGLTGSDIQGSWNPFSVFLFNYPSGFPQAELPYFLLFPAVNFLPPSLVMIKITYVLLSICSVFLIYLVGREIFGKRIGLIAAALAAINPWLIFIGRTNYEVVPVTFFFLVAIFALLKLKSWSILFSFPLFLLAFYSYIGTKVAFVPIVAVVSFYAYLLNKKKYGLQYLILNIAAIFMVVLFALSITNNGAESRASELFTPFTDEVSSLVNSARKDSISQSIFTPIFENKFTIYLKIAAAKTLNIFSPSHLFFRTDNFVSLYRHGLFYYIDAIFLFVGAAFLMFRKRRLFLFMSGLLAAAMLPEILFTSRVDIFSPHLALFFIVLIFIIAVGIDSIILRFKTILMPVFLLLLYAVLFANFANIYFYQYPLQGHLDFPSRVLANYLTRAASNEEKVDLYVRITEDAYRKHIFYTNSITQENISEIRKSFVTHKHSLKNFSFYSCLDMNKSQKPKVLTIYQNNLCEDVELDTPFLKMSQLTDGGVIYRLYNEKFCSKNYAQKPYPADLKLYQFEVEKLSDQEFCEVFVSR